jgi:arginase
VTAKRTYHVLGVPLRTGSYYPGNENDAQAYRDIGLLERLLSAGCVVVDEGDVAIPSYLPHHAIPPIRSWPSPRIVWDHVAERLAPILRQPGHVPLLIGCDCSVAVGSVQALRATAGEDLHVLYVDGDFDDGAPDPGRCQSAAAMAVWLMTRDSPFWTQSPLAPSQVTVLGWSKGPESEGAAIGSMPLTEVRRIGPTKAARQVLAGLRVSTSLLLHLDIDVFQQRAVSAAYFPHTDGLSVEEGVALLSVLLADPRIRIVEVAEYASLRDVDQRALVVLSDLLASALA